MIKKILPFLILFLFPLIGEAQLVRMFRSSTAPTGTCQFTSLTQNTTDSHFYFCDDGVWVRLADVSGTVAFKVQNNIRYADQFAGANAGAKIQAAHDDLPSTGGIVDARGFEGAQTSTATIVLTKPVLLLLGNATLTMSGGATEMIRIGCTGGIVGIGGKWTDGETAGSVLQVATGVAATVDVIRIAGNTCAAAGPLQNVTLSTFVIKSQSGTPGRYGIHLDTTINALFDLNIDQVIVGPLGSYALYLTNPTVADGFFTSIIQNSTFDGGIRLNRAGDTVRIVNNKIRGAGIGIDVDFVAGASTMIIEGNNITSLGGAIYAGANTVSMRILNNEIETPVSFTGSNGAVIDVAGTVGGPAKHTLIHGNSIQVLSANSDEHGIRLDYAQNTEITGNYFSRGAAPAKDISITANATDAHIGVNRYDDAVPTNILADSGVRTTFFAPLTGGMYSQQAITLSNAKPLQWNDDAGTTRSVLRTETDGTVNLYGYHATLLAQGVSGATYLFDGAGNIGFRLGVNCADGAGDAACTSAGSGAFVIDAADTNTVISTTAVTANSEILISEDSSLGARLVVTCNTTLGRTYAVTARTAGTSFTVTASAAPTTNPACMNFQIVH